MSAITNADAQDAAVPDAYMDAALRLEDRARELVSMERDNTGRSRAMPAALLGRTRARVVLPRRMLRNLIPAALPTR